MEHTKVLIVDDDPDIRDILRLTFEAEGYTVLEASEGTTVLDAIRRASPHLVILDYMLPGKDGRQLCQEIKADILLRHLPVIMLTARGELTDKVRGLDAGADDYVVKPFEPQELVARARMVLRRTGESLDANPLTRLPGNRSIHRTLEERLQRSGPLAVAFADLDHFKAFNDYYGFDQGDEAIRQTARVLLGAIRTAGQAGDFVGHIGGDDFVIITTTQRADAICQRVVEEFDRMAPSLYAEADRARGYILSKDRRGQESRFGFMTISLGLVTNERRAFRHVAELSEAGAELKGLAKRSEQSCYVKERRGDGETT